MLDFPASPANGQRYAGSNGVTYTWQIPPGLWTSTTVASPPELVGAYDVRDFGAVGDGVADDTLAFQAAVNAAGALTAALYGGSQQRESWVYVPPGTYNVSFVNVPNFIGIYGNASTLKGPRTTVIQHTDPTQSCFRLNGRCSVRGLYFMVNNTNLVTPVAGPATIEPILNSDYNEVSDCQFMYSYVAIGSRVGQINNAWVINNCSGFVHHRFVYLSKTLDISYVSNLHSHHPEGLSWDVSWYAWTNKVLVEIDDCDGLHGGNWFSYGGRGVFKHSGTSNLLVSVQNAGGENVMAGIEIAAGSTNGHNISFEGGYLQTNNRADGVYLVSNEADVTLHLTNMLLNGSANADYVRVSDAGTTTVLGCELIGATGATAIHKMSATSRLMIDDCTIRSFATVFKFDASCDTLFTYGPMNRLRQGIATLYSPAIPLGYVDITEPVIYETGAGNTQQTVTSRRTPSSDQQLFVANSLLVHQVATNAVGNGGSIEASSANSSNVHNVGSKVRMKNYYTGGGAGAEQARLHLQAYVAGAYGPPFVLFENGSIGYQASLGTGGTVTQLTDKTTGVTLSKTTGNIVMNAASLAANTSVSFTFTNTLIAGNDIVHIKHSSGGTFGAYRVEAFESAGSATVTVTNITAGALAQAITLKFYIFKTTPS